MDGFLEMLRAVLLLCHNPIGPCRPKLPSWGSCGASAEAPCSSTLVNASSRPVAITHMTHNCVPVQVRTCAELGVRIGGEVEVDFPRVMQRMRTLRAQLSATDAASRFQDTLGVDVFQARWWSSCWRFEAPWSCKCCRIVDCALSDSLCACFTDRTLLRTPNGNTQ